MLLIMLKKYFPTLHTISISLLPRSGNSPDVRPVVFRAGALDITVISLLQYSYSSQCKNKKKLYGNLHKQNANYN